MSTVTETEEQTDGSAASENTQQAQDYHEVVPSDTTDEVAAGSTEAAVETDNELTPDTPESSDCAVPLNHISSSPSLEILSPRPSPHIPNKKLMSASVEDCFDEDDDQAQIEVVDTPPSSFCVTTPPINDPPLSPPALYKDGEPLKPEIHIQEEKDEEPRCHAGSPVISPSQNTLLQVSPRRPSVMDYLVSQGSAKNSACASEASGPTSRRDTDGYARWDLARGGANGYDGDDKKSQLNWNGQQPPFRFTDNALSIQSDYGTDVSYREGYTQQYDHSAPPAPLSNVGVPYSDIRSEQQPGTMYSELSSRLESMAPSGYQLLAAKLSGDAGGQAVAPLYRRFDALNHRLLLYFQDEIADLERQLIALEAKDTAKRSYAGGVIPASRRQDRWISGSLADQKTEVLGHIGYKLSQYNQVLASFRKVQDLPVPSWRDIHIYKTYLNTSKLIMDDETRFLDMANDLVSLASPSQAVDDFNMAGDGQTPMPKPSEEQQFPAFFKDTGSSSSTRVEQVTTQRPSDATLLRLAVAGLSIVFVPIMSFAVVPSFAARMTIVFLIALGVGIMIEQSGLLPEMERHKLYWFLYSGVYCGAMAVVAGAIK